MVHSGPFVFWSKPAVYRVGRAPAHGCTPRSRGLDGGDGAGHGKLYPALGALWGGEYVLAHWNWKATVAVGIKAV